MKTLELFCGTKSFSKVAKELGHETFTVDNDKQFNPDLCKDILDLKPSDIPFKPDIIWASPPCTKFSVMTIYRNWEKISKDEYKPKNQETIEALNIVKKTLELIKQLKPKYFFIENPRAMLRKQPFMKKICKRTVTYCQYGLEYQKATDIWNNCKYWKPKPMCSPKSPCHVRAPRGSKYGIQSGMSGFRKNRPNQKHLDTSRLKVIRKSNHPKQPSLDYNGDGSATVLRGIVPKELCEEIIKACEIK